jgi:hypothetical protein
VARFNGSVSPDCVLARSSKVRVFMLSPMPTCGSLFGVTGCAPSFKCCKHPLSQSHNVRRFEFFDGSFASHYKPSCPSYQSKNSSSVIIFLVPRLPKHCKCQGPNKSVITALPLLPFKPPRFQRKFNSECHLFHLNFQRHQTATLGV